MKTRYLLIVALVMAALFMTGCIHLPSASDFTPVPGPSHPSAHAVAAVTHPATAKAAIQHAFDWIAGISVVAGLAFLSFGGLAIYGGRVISGVKLVLAGVALPVVGIWFAYHWGLVFLCVGAAVAAYFLYQDRAQVLKLVQEVEKKAPEEISKVAVLAVPASGPATVLSAATGKV